MTSFAVRLLGASRDLKVSGHIRVTVFAGPDEEHRANVGTLVFLPHEADDFCARFNEARP